MSLEFFLTSLLVIVVPGTGVLYTLAIGLNHGFRASLSAAFGCTLGIIPAATTVILGLSAIFNTRALVSGHKSFRCDVPFLYGLERLEG